MIKPDIMTRQEMLDLLGLKPNYTEQELRKAYRKIARDNHPDLNPGDKEKEKKFKDANNAFEELIKKFKNSDLNEYKSKVLKDITSKFECNDCYLETREFADFKESLEEKMKLDLTNVIMTMGLRNDKDNVKRIYDKFLEKYENELKNFINVYFKNNYINSGDVKEIVDCTTTLNVYFAKLLEIKKKYGKEEEYKNKIKDSVSGYLNDPKYISLKNIIRKRLAKTLNLARVKKYEDIDNLIANLITDIELDIKKYEEYLVKANMLRENLKKSYGFDIINMVLEFRYDESIIDNLTKVRGISKDEIEIILGLDKIDKDFGNMDDDILSKFEKITNAKKNLKLINSIHNEIEEKFKAGLNNKDIDVQTSIITIYKKYLEFYRLVCKGEISFEEYNKLEKLTFADLESDNNILHSLCSEDEPEKQNEAGPNFIYVSKNKNKSNSSIKYGNFCYLGIHGEEMFMMTPTKVGGIISSKVTKEELEENYVTFDEFMKNMEFDGRRSSYWAKPYVVLYFDKENPGYGNCIAFDSDTGEISIDGMYEYQHRYFDEDYAIKILPFEDKNKLRMAILQMFERRLKKFNRINQFTSVDTSNVAENNKYQLKF